MCGGPDIFQQAGDALAGVDKTVNDVIPGGWTTVAALTAGGLALAYAPEVMAFAEANGLTPAAASTELGIAPVNAVTGEAVAPDVFAGLSANAPVDTTLSQAAANSLAASGGAGAGDVFAGLSANAPVDTTLSQAAANSLATGTGAGTGTGTYVTPELMGPTYGELGVTGVPEGGMGPTYAEMGYTGLNQQAAIDAANAASASNLSLSDLNNAKNVVQTANQLLSSPSSIAKTGGLPVPATAATTAAGALPSNVTNNYSSPTATFVHGQQVAVPSIAAPELAAQTYTPQALSPLSLELIQQAKTGGVIHKAGGGDLPMHEVRMRGKQFTTYQPHSGLSLVPHLAPGGSVPEGHNPTFFSPGGLATMENTYVNGEGDGTSDSVAAMLADGEFVIPADVVSRLGNGSNNAGAKVLDNFLVTIREHAQKHDPKELPPDSKGPLAYLLDAKKKARA